MKVYAVTPALSGHELQGSGPGIEALFSSQEKAEEYARTFGIRMHVIAWELDNPEADRVFFSGDLCGSTGTREFRPFPGES